MTAVPAVPTFVDGILDASVLNRMAAAVSFGLEPPIAFLRQAVAQNITNNTFTAITFDSEEIDSSSGHDTSSNTSRFTAVFPGWYLIGGGATFAANATGRRLGRIQINGSAHYGSIGGLPGNANIIGFAVRTVLAYLDVGDYAELAVYQDSGGTLATYATNFEYQSSMTVKWVSN